MLRDDFFAWFDVFKTDPLFDAMEKTVEDSPWHREANTGVHTCMVVSQYVASSPLESKDWSKNDLLGALACVFHDVGKPDSEEVAYSEERGTYRRYYGHEQLSARYFVDYAMRHREDFVQFFNLSANDIYVVAWMIENHLPWQFGDKKLGILYATAYKFDVVEVFERVVMSDQNGRISDDCKKKDDELVDWLIKFEGSTMPSINDNDFCKTVIFLVGASGSGKSTFIKQLIVEGNLGDDCVFSLDELRHRWYDLENYRNAWFLAGQDKQFKSKSNAEFIRLLREHDSAGDTVLVDNTNTVRKGRSFYIAEAKRRHFRTVAYVFHTTLETVLDRQRTRGDKNVPKDAVEDQYWRVQMPAIGEFDDVISVFGE